ncbi:MAG: sigma-70 family RNA polymerase sigma factor [Bacteroidota bacterium]|jgi:RNA polymerase sigma factor (sigma-70 family)
MQTIDDNQLVAEYIQGNEEALAKLVHRHKRRVFSYIYLIVRKKELAEDIFQDTFVKVIHTLKRGQYYEEGKFLPWVLRISRNLMIDHFRRVKKMPLVQTVINEDGEATDIFSILPLVQPEKETMDSEASRKAMRNMVSILPSEQKEVLMMRMYYDMSFKEIAESTNVSINTALGRMRYALINLRKMMEDKQREELAC